MSARAYMTNDRFDRVHHKHGMDGALRIDAHYQAIQTRNHWKLSEDAAWSRAETAYLNELPEGYGR